VPNPLAARTRTPMKAHRLATGRFLPQSLAHAHARHWPASPGILRWLVLTSAASVLPLAPLSPPGHAHLSRLGQPLTLIHVVLPLRASLANGYGGLLTPLGYRSLQTSCYPTSVVSKPLLPLQPLYTPRLSYARAPLALTVVATVACAPHPPSRQLFFHLGCAPI
jgi:hypothetical protein